MGSLIVFFLFFFSLFDPCWRTSLRAPKNEFPKRKNSPNCNQVVDFFSVDALVFSCGREVF